MKKILMLLTCLVCIFAFSACKGPDKENVESTNQITSVTQQEQNKETEDTFIEPQPSGDETNVVPPIAGTTESGENSDDSNTSNTTQHAHTYKKIVTSATCEKDGFTTYSCNCGTKYTDNTVLAKGHQYGEWKEIKAATETAVGKKSRKCKNCDKSEERDIPKIIKGHTHQYNSTITTAATCEKNGVKTFTCSCGASYTETMGKTAHNYSKTVVKPTCKEQGYTINSCECGDYYHDNYTRTVEHEYQSKITEPTCISYGFTTYTCTDCGNYYLDNHTEPTGHKFTTNKVSATCSDAGQTIKKCSCGYSESLVIPALKHSYSNNKCYRCGLFDDESKLLAKNIINQIIKKDMTQWQKALAIHNYLCENVTYDRKNYENNTIPAESYSVIGALKKKTAVCNGYALSFELLCETAGIECEYVSGTSICRAGSWVNHAWNQVKIDDTWYNVDVTWDDFDKKDMFGFTYYYKYFLVSDQIFYKDHQTSNAKHACEKEIDVIKMCMSCTELVPINKSTCDCGCTSFRNFNH